MFSSESDADNNNNKNLLDQSIGSMAGTSSTLISSQALPSRRPEKSGSQGSSQGFSTDGSRKYNVK